jgi:1-acyl-sn-glycerol-3-phosphate acyltransferase
VTFLRSTAFNACFYLWLLIGGGLGLPLLALPRRLSAPYSRLWVRVTLWLLKIIAGLSHQVRGPAPSGPVILAPKHESAWDTFIFLILCDNPAYVLKQELFDLPFYGWFSRKLGMIGVDRAGGASALRGMLLETRAALAQGRPIVIFPQGTRTQAGSGKPYQPGIYAVYRDSGVPVVPVALNSGCFWAKKAYLKRAGAITLEYLPPIPPGLDRKSFMERLENEIETASARLEAQVS